MTSLAGREPRLPVAILIAAFLFNLGQGVLRPSMPLYLHRAFAANYRMVTLIPVVFGAGKWIANMPTGYLLSRLGRQLMVGGLALIAFIDVVSVTTSRFDVFLGLRALGGLGWAMFATVATTATVGVPAAQRRGQAVSVLLMSETSGLFLGSAAGGWLYQGVGIASPFFFEAACMIVAVFTVAHWASLSVEATPPRQRSRAQGALGTVLRTPGVLLMGVTSALSGFVAAVPTTLTSDQVEGPLQGVAIGWLRTMSDSGQIGGPLVMGALADAVDLAAPFSFGAVLLGVTAWACHHRANAMTTAAGGRDS